MGKIVAFPTTRKINPIERHYLAKLQTAIKTVRSEYYLENKNDKKLGPKYSKSLMLQRLVNFMHDQWGVYET